MRYILLIHGSEEGWDQVTDEERHAQYERYGSLQAEMERNGHHAAGDELERAATARLVRVRNGETSVTDGPFAETKEQLGGYFIVECDLATALGYAERIPAAEGGTIEVRPIAE